MKRVLSTGEAALASGLSQTTIIEMFDSGRLRGFHIPDSRERRIPVENLVRFLKEYGVPLGELEDEVVHKILLVGMEADLAGDLMGMLPESEDFRFETADTSFAAGMLCAGFRPRTVIIDFSYGRYHNAEIARRIRANELTRKRRIIGIAGEGPHGENGFDEVLHWPVDPEVLAGKVRAAEELAPA